MKLRLRHVAAEAAASSTLSNQTRIEGIDEPLPAGEQLHWQGAPQWQALARHAFHVRKVALYFALLSLWRFISVLTDSGAIVSALLAALWMLLLGASAIAVLSVLAYATARSTIYAITSRRVVLRIGVALPITINLPLSAVQSAALRMHQVKANKPDSQGGGDIALSLTAGERLAWAHLWPHVRSGRLAQPQPTLRCVPHAAAVAATLTLALNDSAALPPALAPALSTALAQVAPNEAALTPAIAIPVCATSVATASVQLPQAA